MDPSLSNWVIHNNDFLMLNGNLINSDMIYGFDLDGTLISYKNGHDPKRHNSISRDNWIFLGPIKEKIIELSTTYNIFIITNQSKVSPEKMRMIEDIWESLDRIPFVLCANKKNIYRKPNIGFLGIIQDILNNNRIVLNKNNSYFCGDAVGKDDIFIPYRWSSDDKQFAVNCGLNFIRPIDLFGVSKVIPSQDIVMMMGTPGSGKTTFAKIIEENYGYIRFSQDEVGDLKNNIVNIENLLITGKKIVLDATFASFNNRLSWIQLAKKLNKSLLVAWIIRDGRPFNTLRSKPISHFAWSGSHGYEKNFSDPRDKSTIGYDYDVEMIY